eukprot:CAMPEP_0114689650 /NCGR_PEP_ID=MMETSP0191-20121206/64808_1 /TAXON_ID=126664 /ORGANISM="Sorites sp." /LENGTH=360 /DNA_ID=CAMNT_0001978581 /DNA_START=45 /DNA_END=1127 /DNA_ORIENTATION=-
MVVMVARVWQMSFILLAATAKNLTQNLTIIKALQPLGYKDCGWCMGVPGTWCNTDVGVCSSPIPPSLDVFPGMVNGVCPSLVFHFNWNCGGCINVNYVRCEGDGSTASCGGVAAAPLEQDPARKETELYACGRCQGAGPSTCNQSADCTGTFTRLDSSIPNGGCPFPYQSCGCDAAYSFSAICLGGEKKQTYPNKNTRVVAAQKLGYKDCGLCQGVPVEMCNSDTICDPANAPLSSMSYGLQKPSKVTWCPEGYVDCGSCLCVKDLFCLGNSTTSPCGGAYVGQIPGAGRKCGSCMGYDTNDQDCFNWYCRGTAATFSHNQSSIKDCPKGYVDCGKCDCVPESTCGASLCTGQSRALPQI